MDRTQVAKERKEHCVGKATNTSSVDNPVFAPVLPATTIDATGGLSNMVSRLSCKQQPRPPHLLADTLAAVFAFDRVLDDRISGEVLGDVREAVESEADGEESDEGVEERAAMVKLAGVVRDHTSWVR